MVRPRDGRGRNIAYSVRPSAASSAGVSRTDRPSTIVATAAATTTTNAMLVLAITSSNVSGRSVPVAGRSWTRMRLRLGLVSSAPGGGAVELVETSRVRITGLLVV